MEKEVPHARVPFHASLPWSVSNSFSAHLEILRGTTGRTRPGSRPSSGTRGRRSPFLIWSIFDALNHAFLFFHLVSCSSSSSSSLAFFFFFFHYAPFFHLFVPGQAGRPDPLTGSLRSDLPLPFQIWTRPGGGGSCGSCGSSTLGSGGGGR
jgi:hypothetical protein